MYTRENGMNSWSTGNSNGEANIVKRHEYNVQTGQYGVYYVEKDGKEVKNPNGVGFKSFSDAQSAARNIFG